MTTTRIEVEGLDELVDALGPELVQQPMRSFYERWGLAVVRAAKARAPRNKGQLGGSITHEIVGSYPGMYAQAGTNVAHGPYMEFGTGLLTDGDGGGSRHFPPSDALEAWAKKHGAPNGWVIAAAIGRKGGLRPRRFMRDGIDDTIAKVPSYLNRMARDIERAAASGGG